MPNVQFQTGEFHVPTRCVRRMMARRPRERRGIVLVFVVVLLMLLAIMGTAYLAVSRADRLAVTGRGALPGVVKPQLSSDAKLNEITNGFSKAVQYAIIEDLFNLEPHALKSLAADAKATPATPTSTAATETLFTRFRQQGRNSPTLPRPLYHNYDLPGRADRWLSPLLAKKNLAAPDINTVRWEVIGAPLGGEILPGVRLEPFFTDPRWLRRNLTAPANGAPGWSRVYARQDDRYTDGNADYNDEVRATAGTDFNQRRDLQLSAVAMLRDSSNIEASKNTRLYPGLMVPALGNATFIAADAVGDGMPDSGLSPVMLNPQAEGVDRYLDPDNGVIYMVGYRVVDNSAKINVNTAFAAVGDFKDLIVRADTTVNERFPGNDEMRNRLAYVAPNLSNFGFYRSNVGLAELIKKSLEVFGTQEAALNDRPYYREMFRLVDARFPQLGQQPNSGYLPTINLLALANAPIGTPAGQVFAEYSTGTRGAAGTPVAPFEFRSIGDMAEQLIARRPANPGQMRWQQSNAATPTLVNGLVSLGATDAAGWSARGGSLINDLMTPGDAENALVMTTRYAAPNFSANEGPFWKWFPLSIDGIDPTSAIDLWFSWTQDFQMSPGPTTIDATALTPGQFRLPLLDANPDNAGFRERSFEFTAPGGSNLAPVTMPRSLRPILTTISGVTNTVPMRNWSGVSNATGGVPNGMPPYGDNIGIGQYPAIRVAAATATKEQLWRGYWSAMTQQISADDWTVDMRGATDVFEAFSPPDRHPSRPVPDMSTLPYQRNRLDEKQMALIRSAIAACNTIDLRDDDNDITAMTVDLGGTFSDGSGDRIFARVFGTEKQLVISAVVIDRPDPGGVEGPYVGVEIHNPTDEPLNLEGYYLLVAERTDGGGNTTLANGRVEVTLPDDTNLTPLRLFTAGSPVIRPGGFLLVSNVAVTAAPTGVDVRAPENNPNVIPQVVHLPANPMLDQLLISPNAELLLVRTRRADGVAYIETPDVAGHATYPRPAISEDSATDGSINTRRDLLALVPIDAVDTRTLEAPPTGEERRYWYLRNTDNITSSSTTPSSAMWKCFYAGKTYDRVTSAAGGGPTVPSDPKQHATTGWAWRKYPVPIDPVAGTPEFTREQAEGTLGVRRIDAASDIPYQTATQPTPYYAPTIQIQNFKPFSTPMGTAESAVAFEVDHRPNRFPFGSPFARNGDLLAVPFIGSYTIYLAAQSADYGGVVGTDLAIYEYVPLTMDAVNVASSDPEVDIAANPSVGRFDPSQGISPGNEWAADLFDYVTARQSSTSVGMLFPDVPRSAIDAPGDINNPTQMLTDQDGPVRGMEGVNPQTGVPWVTWTRDGTGAARSMRGGGAVADSGQSQLSQGIINFHTAPPVVLRMLPWSVTDAGGLVDQSNATGNVNEPMRKRVGLIEELVRDASSGRAYAAFGPTTDWGYSSLFELGSESEWNTVAAAEQSARLGAFSSDPQVRMRQGLLQPLYRPQNPTGHSDPLGVDFVAKYADLTRVSNLTSPRSDSFTVYITVQAWTWVGDQANGDQTADTRLVGEKRLSYIVDRSRISQKNFQPEDLIIHPIERD